MATKKKRAPARKRAPAKMKRSTRKRAPSRRTPAKKTVRAAFSVGDDVKLNFEARPPIPNGPKGELMWVRVTSIRGARASGWLNDQPLIMRGIRHRSKVSFGVRQVIQVIRY